MLLVYTLTGNIRIIKGLLALQLKSKTNSLWTPEPFINYLKAMTQRGINGSGWMGRSLHPHNKVCTAINYGIISEIVWVVPQL